MTLAQVDLSDVIAGNSALARDHSHQVSGLHPVASSDGHEESGHSSGRSRRAAWTLTFHWPGARGGRLGCLRLSSLRSLALQHVKRGGSHFCRVEFLEQRLERNDFAWRNALGEHGAKLLANSFFPVVSAALRTEEIHRTKSSACQLSQRRHLTRLCEHHHLDGLGLGDSL